MFLPSEDDFLIAAADPVGSNRYISSTADLAIALEKVNQVHWQADATRIAGWRKRGPLGSGKIMIVGGGGELHEETEPIPENPCEYTAQFAFAIYYQALQFSRLHNLPILTDE